MTDSSQPTRSASQGFPSYGPPWHGYDLHQEWLWRISNVPPPAVPITGAVNSRCTMSASRTAGKSSSQSGNIFQLDSSTSTLIQRTWETPDKPPDEMIPAASWTTEARCHRDCRLALIAGDVLQQIWCRRWERQFVRLGRSRRQTPN